ncbi:MAG: hypothetical protein AAFR31_22010, partial [Cyanobacteria bacterium J06627_8]
RHRCFLLMFIVIELDDRIFYPQNIDAGEEVIGSNLRVAPLLNGDDAALPYWLSGQGGTGRPCLDWNQPPIIV